jgi:hypothetical protein
MGGFPPRQVQPRPMPVPPMPLAPPSEHVPAPYLMPIEANAPLPYPLTRADLIHQHGFVETAGGFLEPSGRLL